MPKQYAALILKVIAAALQGIEEQVYTHHDRPGEEICPYSAMTTGTFALLSCSR